jgi:hypothetical protein
LYTRIVGKILSVNRNSKSLTGLGFDLSRGGADHVTELIGDTTERSTETGRRTLGKIDGYDTPCTLNTKLNEESAGTEFAESVWQDPKRDESSRPEDGDDDSVSNFQVSRVEHTLRKEKAYASRRPENCDA